MKIQPDIMKTILLRFKPELIAQTSVRIAKMEKNFLSDFSVFLLLMLQLSVVRIFTCFFTIMDSKVTIHWGLVIRPSPRPVNETPVYSIIKTAHILQFSSPCHAIVFLCVYIIIGPILTKSFSSLIHESFYSFLFRVTLGLQKTLLQLSTRHLYNLTVLLVKYLSMSKPQFVTRCTAIQ